MKKVFDWIIYILTWVFFIAILFTVLGIIFILIFNDTKSIILTIFIEIVILAFVARPIYRHKI